MKVEALVFDMDGLLLDSERVVQRSWNYAGEKLGYGRIGEHIYHTLGFNVVRREAYFKSVYGEDFPMDKFNELTREKYYGICDKEGIGVKEGARELLIYAKEHGYKVGLATSSREIHAKASLEKVGLWKYFDGGVFGDSVKHAKPDPEIYLKACEAIGTEPVHSIALEDAPAGIRSASSAGMIPVMIPDLAQPDEEVRGLCRYVYPTLLDVIKMLDRENAEAGRQETGYQHRKVLRQERSGTEGSLPDCMECLGQIHCRHAASENKGLRLPVLLPGCTFHTWHGSL